MKRLKNEERGEILILITCAFSVLLLLLGLAVDLGNTYLTHLRMRNAVDLAAVTVSEQIPLTYSAGAKSEMEHMVETVIRQSGIDLDTTNLTCEILDGEGLIYAARIILDREIDHHFASLYLNRTSTIHVGNLVYATRMLDDLSKFEIHVIYDD